MGRGAEVFNIYIYIPKENPSYQTKTSLSFQRATARVPTSSLRRNGLAVLRILHVKFVHVDTDVRS